jgi:predicted AAA+ superfamily ATPase
MNRMYEQLLDEYLDEFPCVAIIGPRQCGKTTLVKTLKKNWHYFDMESSGDLAAIEPDPEHFLRVYPSEVVIDESQLLPSLFSALRVEIDRERNRKGRFIITGSSSPELLRSVSESLAGRVGVIELSPFSWCELRREHISPFIERLGSGNVSASDLAEDLEPIGTEAEVADYWFRGGYPEPWLKNKPRSTRTWMDQYVRTYLDRDVAALFPGLNREKFRLFSQMIAGLSGQVMNYSETARALGVSQPTVRDYFEIAHGTFLWRKLPSYERNTMKRIVKAPRGYMRDSGLLHHLLRIPDLPALLGHPVAGRSWEGVVVEEIIRQLNAAGTPHDAYYYRTSGGAEVDLILEGFFGLVPIEIKRGQRVDLRDLRGLKDFINEQNCPFGIVINNDLSPRLYSERMIGIPFTCL